MKPRVDYLIIAACCFVRGLTLRRVAYAVVYYFWVCLPAGMGGAPWHRYNKIFKLERD